MRTLIGTLLFLAVGLSTGCSGGGGSKVNGKIVKGGQPFTLSDKGVFVLVFVNEAENPPKMYNATTKPDGTFTVIGADGKGIPPGKYKVQVQAMDPYPQKDLLGGKFAPAEKSPLTVEVGKGEIVVEVGQ
jgi:hypothetical protein